MRIRCPFNVAGLIALAATLGATSSAEDATVKYVRALPVAKLDKHLHGFTLDDWLRSGPPHLEDLTWKLDEYCGSQPEFVDPVLAKRPLCVKFVFTRRGLGDPIDGYGFIQVGTVGLGIVGPPRFQYVAAGRPIGGYPSTLLLSHLPSLLDEASALEKADREMLNYARALDVHSLDATLPSMGLEDWLHTLQGGEKVIWKTSPSCELKETEPASSDKNDFATCVKFVLTPSWDPKLHPDAWVYGIIAVGTVRKGINGQPQFDHFGLFDSLALERHPSYEPSFDETKLSDLARALAEFSSL